MWEKGRSLEEKKKSSEGKVVIHFKDVTHLWQLPTLSSFSVGPFLLLPPSTPPPTWLTEAVSHHHRNTGDLVRKAVEEVWAAASWWDQVASGGSSTFLVLGVQGPTGQAERALTNKEWEMLRPGGQESYILAAAVPISLHRESQWDNTVIKTEMRPLEDWLECL